MAELETREGTHEARVRDYFDAHVEEWSRSYRRVVTANDVVLRERLELALELTADVAPPGRALDAGCGAGALAVELARRGLAVVATDVSPRMIDRCRETIAEAGLAPDAIDLRCGDVFDTGSVEATFDVVFALGFLQYQEDELDALSRLRALLRPGGHLIVSGPIGRRLGNVFGIWDHVRRLRRRLSAPADGSTNEIERLLAVSRHTYSLGRLRRLLTDAGFETRALRPHGFVNYALIGPALGTRGELRLHRLFTRLSRWLPIGRFANDVVALARRPERETPA